MNEEATMETTAEEARSPAAPEERNADADTGAPEERRADEDAGGDPSQSGGGVEQARFAADGGRMASAPASLPPELAEDRALRAHFDRLWQEAQTLARQVPGFDFARELQDDAFAALLSPRRGLGLEQAYFVRHGRELLAAAERAAEARVTAALQASRRVPPPIAGAAAAPGLRWDQNADAKAREALKARIRRGEKIYPGR